MVSAPVVVIADVSTLTSITKLEEKQRWSWKGGAAHAAETQGAATLGGGMLLRIVGCGPVAVALAEQ